MCTASGSDEDRSAVSRHWNASQVQVDNRRGFERRSGARDVGTRAAARAAHQHSEREIDERAGTRELKTVSDKIRCAMKRSAPLPQHWTSLPGLVCPLALHLIAHGFLRRGSRCLYCMSSVAPLHAIALNPSSLELTWGHDAAVQCCTPPSDISRFSYMDCESAGTNVFSGRISCSPAVGSSANPVWILTCTG